MTGKKKDNKKEERKLQCKNCSFERPFNTCKEANCRHQWMLIIFKPMLCVIIVNEITQISIVK
jgi:hypothetical protein